MRVSILLAGLGLALAACGSPATVRADKGVDKEANADGIAMTSPRAAHAAVALRDGRVLLIGGCVLESCEIGPASATVEAFDPETSRFAAAGRLLERRTSAIAANLPSGEILLAGGWVGSEVTATTELFDPATGRSRAGPILGAARADIAVGRLPDGRVLLAGGYGGGRALNLVEIFDPADATVRSVGRLLTPRAGARAARLPDGRFLIVGGGTTGDSGLAPLAEAEIFDPATGRSTRTGPLAQARYKHAVVAGADGRVFVFGGSDARDRDGKLRSVERYDAASGRFSAAGELIEARFKIADAAVLLKDGGLLIGGGAARAEVYDPATGRSSLTGPDTGRRLNFATATRLPDGRVLLAGGYDEDGIRMNDRAWVLSPAESAPRSREAE